MTEIEICRIIVVTMSIYTIWLQENWFFKRMEDYQCKKYKGKCEECKAWSCERYNQLYEERKNGKK